MWIHCHQLNERVSDPRPPFLMGDLYNTRAGGGTIWTSLYIPPDQCPPSSELFGTFNRISLR